MQGSDQMLHAPAFDVLTTTNPTAAVASLWFLVNALAVYRLAHLVARDSITERPRQAFSNKYHGGLVTLVNCQWCLSFWFALVATVFMYFEATRPWWLVICVVLSLSAIGGILSERFG